jgi:hypothetical protein
MQLFKHSKNNKEVDFINYFIKVGLGAAGQEAAPGRRCVKGRGPEENKRRFRGGERLASCCVRV